MKHCLLFLSAIILTACAQNSLKNISVTEALEKYSHQLADKNFLAFPEVRENPLKWYDSLPETKLAKIIRPGYFTLNGQPGEIFVWQTGVWALKNEVILGQTEFSDFTASDGKFIKSSAFTCYNLEGTGFRGKRFQKEIRVPAGRVQALWMGVDLDSIPSGIYRGTVTVVAGQEKQAIPVALNVSGNPVLNHGYNGGSHLSRLNWLNSTTGSDDNVTKGYIPVRVDGNTISILGRTMEVAGNGLPASIHTYFGPSNQSLTEKAEPVVSHPFSFIIERQDGRTEILHPGRLIFNGKTNSDASWKVNCTSADFNLEVNGRMEFDGFCDFRLKLKAINHVKIRDIRLEIPVEKEKAAYMMGLGYEGGLRPNVWKWQWDVSKDQDMLWLGAVNGGLRIRLKAENWVRPLINVYYKFGPLKLPPSWGNDGKGGVTVSEEGREVKLRAWSGSREIKRGEVLNYNFELLLTPFKVIDRKIKFGDRYYHGGGTVTSVKVDSAKHAGANILNIHHAEDIYPFINYPYLDANTTELRQLADKAHSQNIRLKVYYTTREFTKNLPEFWAFYSLNGEVVYPGPGNSCKTVINPDGPKEWYIKNLRENYIPAWYNEIKEGKFKGETDLSVISTPDSRLNNFYVAGLDWMVQNLGIDGVYIDDSALDRYTLMRARKIIDKYRPEGRMDLHSWNHFNEWAGYASCLNLYMDLLPYFDLLWIGEGRDYNRAPDHWLVEVSGMPFGLPGQMLEGGGNPWRGMVYGITNRAGYLGISPSGLWKFWDEYKIEDKIMRGYWESDNPLKVSDPSLKASLYSGKGEAIIAIANWSAGDKPATVAVSWPKLGMDPSHTEIFIPEIAGFQQAQEQVSLNKLVIPGKKGYLIVLRTKSIKLK